MSFFNFYKSYKNLIKILFKYIINLFIINIIIQVFLFNILILFKKIMFIFACSTMLGKFKITILMLTSLLIRVKNAKQK